MSWQQCDVFVPKEKHVEYKLFYCSKAVLKQCMLSCSRRHSVINYQCIISNMLVHTIKGTEWMVKLD